MSSGSRSPGIFYLAITLLVATITIVIDQASLLKSIDNVIYDRLVQTAQRPASGDIVIIAIDEKSLEQLGRWPWPRETHTRLLKILNGYEPQSIGIDIMFSEPSPDPDVDAELAEAISLNENVVLPVVPVYDHGQGEITERYPVAALEQAAARLGSVDAEIDSDGISRGLFLLSGLSMPIWPSFPVAMVSLTDPSIEDQLPGARHKHPEVEHPGEWVRDHHVLIPFSGPPGHYTRISYSDVLHGNIQASDIDGKHVLVGLTAAGIGDRMPTPSTGHEYQMPGVEYMANVLDAFKDGSLITSFDASSRAALIFGLVVVTMLLYPLFSVWLSLLIWVVGMIMAVSIATVLFQLHLWFPPAALLASLFLAFPVWAWSGYRSSSRLVTKMKQERSATMDAVDHGLIILDRDMVIDHMNALAEKIAGVELADVAGKEIRRLLPDGEHMEALYSSHPTIPEWLNWPDNEGRDRDVYLHINPFSDRWGGARGYVLNLALRSDALPLSDTAGRFRNADHGLVDRTYISEYLQRFINAENPDGLFVFHIEIDNLAIIASGNITVSSEDLMYEYVSRLKSSFGNDYPLGRTGSDQLVSITPGSDMDAAVHHATTIVDKARQSVNTGNNEFILSVNVGISHYPSDGADPETLLKHASFAIRQNESRSRTRYKFYSRRDHEISLLDHDIEQRLRKALEYGALALFFQPQISLVDGSLVGFEALLRWNDEGGRQISIDKLITVAEQSELIHEIGQWVMETALTQLATWQTKDIAAGRISVNLSPADLEREAFLKETLQIIEKTGIPPGSLEFEITEHSVMQNTEITRATLECFRGKQINLSIDDFGTGYSSFDYLKNLSVNTVKIDKSFVESITDIRDDAFIVMSMISMAHGLGIEVIAEGIEKPEQAKMLAEYGCDIIQGYLISRPIPAADVAKWIESNCIIKNGEPIITSQSWL